MDDRQPRVLTIPPSANFLEALTDAVLAGFPRPETLPPPDPLTELPRWTLLVPTRRAARQLEDIFRSKLGPRGGLLPAIRPIGDIDEELLAAHPSLEPAHPGIPDAISPLGRELVLINLIDDWVSENPGSQLAREIADSPAQALALAQSLAEFVDTLETEEIGAVDISGLYDLESARHREAVLDFLALARVRLPALLKQWQLSGPKERQSRIIRQEAHRLGRQSPKWPIVAAGSTGTIPATRELLLAISRSPGCAVVLPGLDLGLDELSWNALGPQHPQYALKELLGTMAVDRKQVTVLAGCTPAPRDWMMTEFMRPPEGSAVWIDTLKADAQSRTDARRGLTLIETRSREEEALTISLMLREAHEIPDRTACLITPDRDLARRVKQELKRWTIDIDDTAGQPLIDFAGPGLLALLLVAIESGFGLVPMLALVRHPMVTAGLDSPAARQAASLLDLALFRKGSGWPGLSQLCSAYTRNKTEIEADSHAHEVFHQFVSADWQAAAVFLEGVVSVLEKLGLPASASLSDHLDAIQDALQGLAGPVIWADEPGAALNSLIAAIKSESGYSGTCGTGRVIAILMHRLRTEVFRPSRGQTPRLAIYGLLEARLMRADLHVLGGLNENIWPALPDTGPWLNRPMREKLRMQLPERAIGQTAHDLVQAMGADEVRLVWSRRIGDSPANPSRWILRLKLLLSDVLPAADSPWLQWARQLLRAESVKPGAKPKPCPPVSARPARMSVTQVETLIRDPYAFYARQILKLNPLPDISMVPGYDLRGTLYHEAIGKFLRNHPVDFPQDALEKLLAISREVFAPHFDIPLIRAFWWPRFQRIAAELVAEDRSDIVRTYAETGGSYSFDVAGRDFKLTGRADRLDLLKSGEVAILDYKTGTVPSGPQVKSGLAPQLPLEAAMVSFGAFKEVGSRQVSRLEYVKLSGGSPAIETTQPKLEAPVMDLSIGHFERLRKLLEAYANPLRPYFPRNIVVNVDDVLSHDHLSRYLEWRLSGESA